MSPKLITLSPFVVTGIGVRTINTDEFNPVSAKLPMLWGKFFTEGVAEKIENRLPDSPIYGVYSDYETDASGAYSVLAGVASSGPALSPFKSVTIQEGKYLVFENKGVMPQAVINAWMQVWTFFQQNTEYTRSFATDFEAYRSVDEIAIHIGVQA
jgi:predicted transcriptional regulator YdeE